MKSIHVISSIMPNGGGPSYTVPRLAEELRRTGWDTEIAALDAPNKQTSGGVKVNTYPRDTTFIPAMNSVLAKLGSSKAMANGLGKLEGDVIHGHGLWLMTNVYAARLARQQKKPLVLAPRGMLGADALKFSASVKRISWALWQRQAVQAVNCFHATAESELEDIRAFGLKAPVAIVPNGVDLPLAPSMSEKTLGPPYILSLARLHPKKNLDNLIAAFAHVASEFPDWQLKIVGIDENRYAELLLRAISVSGLEGRADVQGPVFGRQKDILMASAELFALPSLHENFAVTVAESLALETPVISSKGAPWSRLIEKRCGWWVDHDVETLAATLRTAMTLPSTTRAEMGARGRHWMSRDFAWEGIAKRMSSVYDWLSERGPRPDCVVA